MQLVVLVNFITIFAYLGGGVHHNADIGSIELDHRGVFHNFHGEQAALPDWLQWPDMVSPIAARVLDSLTTVAITSDFVDEVTLRQELRRKADDTAAASSVGTLCTPDDAQDCAEVYGRAKAAVEHRQVFSNCTTVTALHEGAVRRNDILVMQVLISPFPRLVQRTYMDVVENGEHTASSGKKHFRSVWLTRKANAVVGGYDFQIHYDPVQNIVNATVSASVMPFARVFGWSRANVAELAQQSVDYSLDVVYARAIGNPPPPSPWEVCNGPMPEIEEEEETTTTNSTTTSATTTTASIVTSTQAPSSLVAAQEAPMVTDAMIASAKLGAAEAKEGSIVDPQVIAIYKAVYQEKGGDKNQVCDALGLAKERWGDIDSADAFCIEYLGAK